MASSAINVPVRKQKGFLSILLLLLFIALSCQEKELTEPEDDPGIRTDDQLLIDRYVLEAGETAEFPSGFEIVAREGVDIQGDILVKPVREGDFTIRCLNGDMILNGKISVDTTVRAERRSSSSILKGAQLSLSTNYNFILETSGGHFTIGSQFQAHSESGMSAPAEFITGAELDIDGAYIGAPGEKGGYIHITVDGTLFLQKRSEEGSSIFILGNGGRGADLIVRTETFDTISPQLQLVGGRGGNSGSLQIIAEKIQGLEDIPVSSWISGGLAGPGGSVVWDVGGVMTGSPTPDKRYPLQEIFFFGGAGGDGAYAGGKGGSALYWSYRVINELGDPIASVTAIGGDGGNVKVALVSAFETNPEQKRIPIPLTNAFGGNGGGYVAVGNMGWDGVHPDDGEPIDGADGGDVFGRGGAGGSVDEDVLFLNVAWGGDGGQLTGFYRDTFLGTFNIPDAYPDFTSLLYGVVAGSGGKGASGCEGCPGGKAGNAGKAEAYGGDGGNAPHRMNGLGGRGGDVWTVASIQLSGATGGDGMAPGEGGCPGTVSFTPGKGGLAYSPGADGQHLGRQVDTQCSEVGNQCIGGLGKRRSLCEVSEGDCNFQIGDAFEAFASTETVISFQVLRYDEDLDRSVWVYIGDEILKSTVHQEGTLIHVDDNFGGYNTTYRIKEHSTYYREYIGTVLNDDTSNREFEGNSHLYIPNCIDGKQYIPGRDIFEQKVVTAPDTVGGNMILTSVRTHVRYYFGCSAYMCWLVERCGTLNPGDPNTCSD